MGIVSNASVAPGGRVQNAGADSEIFRMAASLMAEYRDDADIEAARRADGLFLAGNAADATRWLNVFRTIAFPRPKNAA